MSLSTQTSRRGSALLIGLIMTLLIAILVISFTEKVLRFARGSHGIEQSTQAYYAATSIIETSLMNTTSLRQKPWTIAGEKIGNTNTGAELTVYTGSNTIPVAGKGNSPFDPNYNLISISDPVQIVVPNGVNWGGTDVEFRVPVMSGAANNDPDPVLSDS